MKTLAGKKPPEPFTIVIPGEPVSALRARHTGHYVYTPAKYANWLKAARLIAASQCSAIQPVKCPVSLSVQADFPIPPSWPKWKQDEAGFNIDHTGTPDLDNVVKAAADCLKGIAWIDDSQVVELEAFKGYGQEPELRITVTPRWYTAPSNVNSRKALEKIIS